jgi:hypothetical protein
VAFKWHFVTQLHPNRGVFLWLGTALGLVGNNIMYRTHKPDTIDCTMLHALRKRVKLYKDIMSQSS